MIRIAFTLTAAAALAATALPSLAQTGPIQPRPGSTPIAQPNLPSQTPFPIATIRPAATAAPGTPGSPLGPAASPTPSGALLRFTGQLLDLRAGYVYFTTGDAFKVAPALKVDDYDKGGPPAVVPGPRVFARAILDPSSHEVVQLDVTRRRLAPDAAYAAVTHPFVVSQSAPKTNPELAPRPGFSGKEVAVSFVVEVPPTTPIDAQIYVSTDVSQWNPQAILLNRVDATHYRTVARFASGTTFFYRVTRGSWETEEIGQDGLEDPPTRFLVREADAQLATHTVYHWRDERAGSVSAPAAPGAIPTPFNPNPFNPANAPGIFRQPPGAPTPGPRTPNLPPH
ncbi:MAG TPA: hypothetical protein VFB22_06575 [Candidatus Baltobacteraceae bacterium]|nr:hypothetical protein [Candidatus Baltobacteraceae bacterium]